MVSKGDKLTGSFESGGDVSAGGNSNLMVDLNSSESDSTADTNAAAVSAGVSKADAENRFGEVSKVINVPTVGSATGDEAAVNDLQKKIRRAERFGMPAQLSEEEKRNSRAERFGTATALNESVTTKKAEELKRKARAERFGLAVSAAPAGEEAKKKARLARFGAGTKPDSIEEEKRKARAIRFSNPASNSSSRANGKETVRQEAVITGI